MRHATTPRLLALKDQLDALEAGSLSPFASLSREGARRRPEDGQDEDHRQPFAVDGDRVLHSRAYTRYIDKTQVFYMVENDHITHRVLHVQLVAKIARTIGRYLRLNEDLIEAIANVLQLCEELNLPIQAGDDEILRRMARRYTVSQYTDLVARIRATIPDIALSTDVIVGFPGETVEQFEHTLDVLRQVEFDVVHVAAYSPRPGTAAARKMVDDVPAPEKLRRLHQIEELQTALSTRKNNRLIGQEVELLVEGRQKGKWRGRTRSNKLLFLESDLNLRGELVTAVVEAAGPWSLRGRLETSAAGPLSTGSPGSR